MMIICYYQILITFYKFAVQILPKGIITVYLNIKYIDKYFNNKLIYIKKKKKKKF